MKIHVAILSAALTFGLIGSAAAREIPVTDVLNKASEIEGKSVTIKDCSVVNAARDFLACGVADGKAVSVVIDGGSLNGADL